MTSPFSSLVQWFDGVLSRIQMPAVPAVPQLFSPAQASAPAVSAGVAYEPRPVILGDPDVALVGDAPAAGVAVWNPGLNYQGLQISLLVLDRSGTKWRSQPVSAPPKVGERFKLVVTPSFDAQVQIDQVTGEGWALQRGPQIYPGKGFAVTSAGQSLVLPEGDRVFTVTPKESTRFVVSVRHPKATAETGASQPAYRRDGARASQYLQLVPKGSYPMMEQLVSASR